jgi:AbrB family looped-hinge helix DNA binding protein
VAKVTSKLQVTVPKAIAVQYGIRPGDELDWIPAGDAIRVQRAEPQPRARAAQITARRLSLFDGATERQLERQKGRRRSGKRDRGWTREDLYDRGISG